MPKWDDEQLNWRIESYRHSSCYTCVYRDRGDIGAIKGAAKNSCEKYPQPRYSIGTGGKPYGILEGAKQCPYYRTDF